MEEDLKNDLINAVIAELVNDVLKGDYTVLEEILNTVPDKILIHSLPEEDWVKYD